MARSCFAVYAGNRSLVEPSSKRRERTSAAEVLCNSLLNSGVVKLKRHSLLLILQLGSQTLCRLLDADRDDPCKDFFDDGQKTEIAISVDGDFGEMKKMETPSKRRRVGRYADAIKQMTKILTSVGTNKRAGPT